MSLETAFEIGQATAQIKRIADLLEASQKDIFVRLPGLQGYWPMGIRLPAGVVVDHSGGGVSLFQTGTCPTGFDGNAFVHTGSGTNFLTVSGSLGITGLETFIDAGIRGLTVGGWFFTDTLPSTNDGLISKWDTPPERGYGLALSLSNEPFFNISNTGGDSKFILGQAVALGSWHFFVGRFTPSTEVAVFTDGVKDANTTAIQASVHISTAAFNVGRWQTDNTRIFHGKCRDVFVCAASLDDELLEEVRLSSVP